MVHTLNQRWRAGRDSYRPPEEVIDTRRYEIAPIATDNEAKAFVSEHHYSRSFPAARFRFGLYRRAELVGVAVFSTPCRDSVLTDVFPVPAIEASELGRFVLLDDVPGNGETWFLARCFELLRGEIAGVVSHSDPLPRRDEYGVVVFPGHIGTIYQAHNAVYVGRANRRTIRILPDGTVFSDMSMSKIRGLKRGWRYAVEQLRRFGAAAFDPDRRYEWLDFWRAKLTRAVRHPGNHRYAWALDRALRKHVAALACGPYPKLREQGG